MVYVFYFLFCENNKFILVCFSTHAFMVCLVFQEFTG